MNDDRAFAFFDTAIGRCAVAWGENGILATTLPGATERGALARFHRLLPGAGVGEPPPRVAETIDGITALLAGEPRDLRDAILDTRGVASFDRRVYDVARRVMPGETIAYGEVAARVGPGADPRKVGRAMARNRYPLIVPCHRVVAAGGRLGGFSAPGGARTKLRLLEIEAAHATGPLTLFDAA